MDPSSPTLRLRLVFGARGMIGPGKAELLAQVDATGSIAAAGRAMGMSYSRAFALVEALNALFGAPVVVSMRGGARGGGASLTPLGRQVLDLYRAATARAAAAPEIAALAALARPPDEP